jgi:hypothetical protein
LKGRTRIVLLVIAGMLAVALAPGETLRLNATLAPTLLAPPLGVTP